MLDCLLRGGVTIHRLSVKGRAAVPACRPQRAVVAVAALWLLAACARGAGPSFDPATDFSRYTNYSWPAKVLSRDLDAAQTGLIRNAADGVLAEKGYALAAEGLLVMTFTATLQSLEIPEQRYATRPSVQFRQSPVAGRVDTVLTLAVSATDGASRRSVWRHTESRRLGGQTSQEIVALTRAVLRDFPRR